MNFIQVWLWGYTHPTRFIHELETKTTPHWGFYATALRGLVVPVFLYLPVALMGRSPPTPSYLSLIETDTYYWTLVWLTPFVFFFQWLLGAAILHTFFGLINQKSHMDQIINLSGMSSLVITCVLLVWDWCWFAIGGVNQIFLGISHLVIDLWWLALVVLGLHRMFGITIPLAITGCLLAFMGNFPIAVILMRAPF
jgi:hypothetical protein